MRKEINLETGEITEHPDAPVTWDTSDKRTYGEKRASEYPAIGDQLDALFHAGVFPADMAAQIQAIKDKYPKE